MRWFTWIFVASSAFAQGYVTRAVLLIIPPSPQGTTDIKARALVAELGIQRQ